MIGSLVSYVLVPLSRYLTRRSAEASNNSLAPAVVNGTAEWDGGVDQTTLLDQSLTPSSGTEKGETEETRKEPRQEQEGDPRSNMDEEQLVSAQHEQTNNEASIRISEDQTEMRHQQPEDRVETLKQGDGEITVIHEGLQMKQITADGNICAAESTSSEQALTAQLKRLQTEDSMQGNVCPAQEQIEIKSTEKLLIPPVASTETPVAEYWDEYMFPKADDGRAGASRAELGYSLLPFDAQAHTHLSGQHSAPAGWHFPAGPGLAEEMLFPMWQFPAVSYYPPAEQTFPFEVTWRLWEEMETTAAKADLIPFPFTASLDFTVMSYNILAQDLIEANEELYRHSSLEVLDWSYRYNLLMEEIQKWAPDILCLQEVQENHYLEHLYPVFCQIGYTCVYKRRTGTKTDGCATCYRSSCFSEVSLTQLEFFKSEIELLDRHNVGIVLLLEPVITQDSEEKAKGPPLCVANTHLLFNPRRGDVKLAQLAVMLAEIDRMIKCCKVKGQHCNVIFCGDFNSVPHMPLYQLITTGELYFQGLPAWMISGQEDQSHKSYCHRLFAPLWPSSLGITDNCQYTAVNDMFESQNQKPGKCQYSHDFMLQLRYCPAACVRPRDLDLIPGVTDNTPDVSKGNQTQDIRFKHVLSHRLDLESVYQHVLPGSGSSEVTTLNSEVGATVDYIFYSPQRFLSADPKAGSNSECRGLKLTGRLSLLSEDVLWGLKGLPNDMFPSDHLSLVAKFQLDCIAA